MPARYVDEIIRRLTHLGFRFRSRENIFSDIYRGNKFGGDESVSGPGSSLAQTSEIRKKLPELLKTLGVHSLIDAPCGDFNWMKEVELHGITYIGADIVEELVDRNNRQYAGENRRFIFADIVKDILPAADIILCRDCFVHLSTQDIRKALANFKKSGAEFLLTTTFTELGSNSDMVTGRGWRPLNLLLPPFDFPHPITVLNENCSEAGGRHADKSLGLWRFDDIVL